MTECTCYMDYPNPYHRHKNGRWKCVDDYECVRPLDEEHLAGLPFPRVWHKTKCVKVRCSKMLDLRILYQKNADFSQYVDKYCTKNEISVDEALTHSMVKNVAQYYLDINKSL